MRKVISMLMLFSFFTSSAQKRIDNVLAKKLENANTFYDFKETTLNHFHDELKNLRSEDTIKRYKIEKQLKHWNRKFWIDQFYTNSEGKVVDSKELNYNAVLKFQKNKPTNKNFQPSSWTLHGPNNLNNYDGIGRIDHIAFHPTNVNIMWAGSPLGGLFKTISAGAVWFPLATDLPLSGVAGIAVNPQNPDIIYVLSGSSNDGVDFFGKPYGAPSAGIFKTMDGGITWSSIATLTTGRDIVIDPINPNILLVATSGGIYRSNDAGLNWNLTSPNTDLYFDLEFQPGNPNVVYAVTNNRFYKSINNGSSFVETNISGLSGGIGNRMVIGTTSDNPNRVYLFSGPTIDDDNDDEPDRFQGFYTSNDGGNSFSLVTQTPVLFASYAGVNALHDQSGYNIAIEVNPLNENEIYVGGLVVWHSDDGGATWNQISKYWAIQADYMHPDVHDLQINPLNNKMYVGNDGGVYRQDNFDDWVGLFSGLSVATFYKFEIEDDNGKVWGGTQDNGILVEDSGSTYFEYAGGDGYDVMTDHPYLVANGESDDVFYVINKSICKDRIGNNCTIGLDDNEEFFANLAMSPIDEEKIYAGYNYGLFRSNNAGGSWDTLTNKAANWAVSTCLSNDDIVYFSGTHGNFPNSKFNKFTSPNVIDDFTSNLISAGYISGLMISDIDVSRTNHNVVFISVAGTSSSSKVFKTTNGGTTWQNLSFNLPNVPMFSIKSDENGGIYVGTSIGVYYLPNNQSVWMPFYNDLPPVPITEIELSPGLPPFNKVYVSTFGRGIWYTDTYLSNCYNYLSKTGSAVGRKYYEANIQLSSTQKLKGGISTKVIMNSGNRIKLLPGFHATSGNYLKTYLLGCGASIPN